MCNDTSTELVTAERVYNVVLTAGISTGDKVYLCDFLTFNSKLDLNLNLPLECSSTFCRNFEHLTATLTLSSNCTASKQT